MAEETGAAGEGGRTPRRGVSRRAFLQRGALGAAAVGAAASIPGLPALLQGLEGDAPAATGAVTEGESAVGPIVAHVTDASTGEVSLYVGEREVAYRDPVLVRHLLRATAP